MGRFRSPKGYEYLRRSFLKLLCKTTLNKYVSTGNEKLIENVRLCFLILDKMVVKERVSFSKFRSKVFGLDYKKEFAGGTSKIANQLVCFVVYGLTTKYIIPVRHHFHRQLNSQDLHKLTLDVIGLLSKCSFTVIRLVSDNHRTNTATFRRFGNGR